MGHFLVHVVCDAKALAHDFIRARAAELLGAAGRRLHIDFWFYSVLLLVIMNPTS